MYDTLFSRQWIFDRCLEQQPLYVLYILLVILILGLISTILIWRLRTTHFSYSSKVKLASIPIILADLLLLFFFLHMVISQPLEVMQADGKLVFLLIAGVTNLIWFFVMKHNFQPKKTPHKSSWKLHASNFLLASLALAPTFGLATLIVGFVLCLGGTYIRTLDAAHAIHAIIKERYKAQESMPQNLQDLKHINPDAFKILTDHAKLAYVVDNKTHSYTFFVRPSSHYVAVFDDKKDIVIYKLDPGHYYFDSDQTLLYPPKYPGPWEQLPE